MTKNNFFGKIKRYIKDMDEEIWKNFIFFMFFTVVLILQKMGIYQLNDNYIVAFTFGTLLLSFSDWVQGLFSKRVIYFTGIFVYFGVSNCESIIKLINSMFPEEALLIMSIITLFGSMILNGAKTRRDELRVKVIIQQHNKTIMEYKDTTSMLSNGIEVIESGIKQAIGVNTKLLQIISEEENYNKEKLKVIVEDVIKQNDLVLERLEDIKEKGKVVSNNINRIENL